MLVLLALAFAAPPLGAKVEPLALPGGTPLLDGSPRPTAVVFLGVRCPLAKLYAPRIAALQREFPGVRWLALAPHRSETPEQLQAFAKEFALGLPLLPDDGRAARALGATHTPEAVALDAAGVLRYRGRIDDQYTFAAKLPAPRKTELRDALAALLAGKAVAAPETAADGCAIELEAPPVSAGPTWNGAAGAIVGRRCGNCHQPGAGAPFALRTFRETQPHLPTIREVLRDGRMPPWGAVGPHGVFANDLRLTDDERHTIDAWLAAGAPEGDPQTPAPAVPPRPRWQLANPDLVVPMPVEFAVPAEGVVEYQEFDVPLGNAADLWVSGVEIRPGNPAVVHHINVFLKPPGADGIGLGGPLGSVALATVTTTPQATILPEGMAKRIPAGWSLRFIVHYTPIGKPATDRSSVALKTVPAHAVRREVATGLLYDNALNIPPHAPRHEVRHAWTAPADLDLLAFFPHLHLRGKSFAYDAVYPDGRRERLLDVARFDFMNQFRYDFATPKRLPKGTVLEGIAVYDNSSGNPANPDPALTVFTGKQTWDEMFNGYFDWTPAAETPPAAPHDNATTAWLALAGLGAAAWLLRGRPQALKLGGLALLYAALAVQLPAVLRRGLDHDAQIFDAIARGLADGQAPYRDFAETNFPGAAAVHLAAHTLLGKSQEAVHAVDLLLTAAWAALLARWLPAGLGRWLAGGVLFGYYLWCNEWCHCQRDFWLLIPALLGVELRQRQAARVAGAGTLFAWAVAEGLLWGTGCWLKPHLMVPGAFVVAAAFPWSQWRRGVLDLGGMLLGGSLAGAAGVAWLAQSGGWPAFVECMTVLNRDYLKTGALLADRWMVLLSFVVRFLPWSLAPAAAGAWALAALRSPGPLRLPAALTLGWLFQAALLQHPFDYIRAATLALCTGFLLAAAFRAGPRAAALAGTLAALAALSCFPEPARQRAAVLGECLAGPATPALRNRLAQLRHVDFAARAEVAAFLRRQGARHGEVTCFSMSTLAVLNELDLRAATRWMWLRDCLVWCPSHRERILADLAASPQRWLLCDLHWRKEDRLKALLDAPTASEWRRRAVFRSGQYVVFQLSGPETARWVEEAAGF